MSGICVARFKAGGCTPEDIVEGHVPVAGQPLPKVYGDKNAIVIGVFQKSSQGLKLLRIISELDKFDLDAKISYMDALMEVTRELAKYDSAAAAVQDGTGG